MSPGVLGERNPIVWLLCIRNLPTVPTQGKPVSHRDNTLIQRNKARKYEKEGIVKYRSQRNLFLSRRQMPYHPYTQYFT